MASAAADNSAMRFFSWLAALALGACAPSWDWRELPLSDAALVAQFPCKPTLRGETGAGLAVCEAHGLQFSLSWQRLDTPEQLRLALREGPRLLASRLGHGQTQSFALALPSGAHAWPEAGGHELSGGARPARLLTWARGLTVYQALIQGEARRSEDAQQFFKALRHPGA